MQSQPHAAYIAFTIPKVINPSIHSSCKQSNHSKPQIGNYKWYAPPATIQSNRATPRWVKWAHDLNTSTREYGNTKPEKGKPTADIFKEQENEKKWNYQQRALDIEMGSFTPLVFRTNGGMGGECKMFLRQLAEKMAKKNDKNYASVTTWLRARLSFEILRSIHLSFRQVDSQ